MFSSCLRLLVVFQIFESCILAIEQRRHIIRQMFSAHQSKNFVYSNGAAWEPDVARNVTELITSKGYACENHEIITRDGFLLSLQRIPRGRSDLDGTTTRPVVFLQHGLLDSSATWVMNSANESLGFILADAGFDVWLGNVRGNTYSRRHVKLKPADSEFWAWSWDEMAAYDLPAMINLILLATGQSELFYVGHSQGSLIAFTGFSRNVELARKVKALVALGPVYTVGHLKGLMRLLVDALPGEKYLIEKFGVHEFLPTGSVFRILAETLCSNRFTRNLCENFIFLVCGFDYKQFNVSRMPVYFSHTPAGTSVQNILHFAQMVLTKRCRAFDYGNETINFRHYNQSTPPEYDVTPLSVPTYLFSGSHDWLSDTEDVRDLVARLKCVVAHEILEGWEHLDFTWSYRAASTLYPKIVNILRSHL